MADLINLNRARKTKAREQAAKQADVNRVKFGRTKSERSAERLRARQVIDLLDQHRIDGRDAS